jgi:hypothetical protein
MFSFFKKNKLNFRSVILPETGWVLYEQDKTISSWHNEAGNAVLSFIFFDKKPDMPIAARNIDAYRSLYRMAALQQEGGIIESDFVDLKGITALRFIIKVPMDEYGTRYLSAVTIPFRNCSYVIRVQAEEAGTTGIRDAFVASQLMATGEIKAGDNGFENWFADPYDKIFSKGRLMNKSEDRKYDAEFPNHPLTTVRQMLQKLETEIRFEPEIYQAEQFWQ